MLLFLGINTSDCRLWLDRAGAWAPLVFILLGISLMSALVPKTAVSVTAGALFGTLLGSCLMLIIAVVAAALNYAIGRWWLHQSINRKLLLASERDHVPWVLAVRDVARTAGFRFHFLIRLAPIPTTLISYAMGASGSRIRPFLLAAAVAVIPQSLWVHGGTAAMLIDDPSPNGLGWTSVIVSVLAAIAISIIVPRMAMTRIESMKNMQTSGAMD
jgi:uncharacterized membrane protein YdjX (TVP38/TMEM64 family)